MAYAMQEFQGIICGDSYKYEASDVVVWFQGQSADPAVSRIGGRPFWPRGVEWPRDGQGNPLSYIAQISLEDSRDVLPERCDWTHVFWFQDHSVDVDGPWAVSGGLPIRAIGVSVGRDIESGLPDGCVIDMPERHGVLIRVRELGVAVDYSDELEKSMESHGFLDMLPEHIAVPPLTKIGGLPPLGASGVGNDGDVEWLDDWDGQARSICQLRLPFGDYPWGQGYGMLYESHGQAQCAWVWE